MKIAVIGARGIRTEYSGIEKNLREICPRLVERGHQVYVFSQKTEDRKPYQGVNIVPVSSLQGKHTETLSRSARSILKSVYKDFDIINIQAEGSGIFSFIPRFFGVKCVFTIHGLDWQRAKWSPFAKFSIKSAEKIGLFFSHKTTVVSQSLQNYFQETYDKETVFIPNGINVKNGSSAIDQLEPLGLKPREFLLFANRIVPEKGGHDLIKAFNEIDTHMKLVIAGGARYQDTYYEELKSMANPDKVVFTGHASGDLLDQLFKHSYLFVLPSYIEGLSNSLLEALGYYKCTLISNIPENKEVVEDCGYTFEVGNVDSLREKIQELLNDEQKILTMENRLPDFVKNKYDWDQVVDSYEQLFESLSA